jgi:plastocyanin
VEPVWEFIQGLWDSILELTQVFVMPDWGEVISLLPVILLLVVIAFLAWFARRWMSAGPTRRGYERRPAAPPAGIHMPGPSLAPILASFGAFVAFAGLVLGGWVLVAGLSILALTLLYWLREAMTDYEHAAPDEAGHDGAEVPATIPSGPPPGVHVPGPSYRPFLVSLAAAVLFLGVVFGGALLIAGLIVVVWSLLGWLRDARREYNATVEADSTGHLDNGPDPRFPTGSFAAAAVLVAVAIAINAGVLPPASAGDGGTGASPAPGASAEPGASAAPGGSAEPGASAAPEIPQADVTITAQGIAFLETDVVVPADRPFTIAFVNLDAGVPHNIEIKGEADAVLFLGDIFNGVETRVYEVPALPAGTYPFLCTVHPNMVGTMTAGG